MVSLKNQFESIGGNSLKMTLVDNGSVREVSDKFSDDSDFEDGYYVHTIYVKCHYEKDTNTTPYSVKIMLNKIHSGVIKDSDNLSMVNENYISLNGGNGFVFDPVKMALDKDNGVQINGEFIVDSEMYKTIDNIVLTFNKT